MRDRRGYFGLFRSTALALALMTTGGCAASIHSFIHPQADLAYYESVGVVPFRSLSGDRLAGEKFTLELITALLASDLFEVVDHGIFVNAVGKVVGSRAPIDGLNIDQLQRLSEEAGVQGVFEGSVTQYETMTSGNDRFPVISVEARLVDTETGRIVWSATATDKGKAKVPILGWGQIHTLGELSRKVSKRLVRELE